MLKIRLKETGEIREVTRNVAFGLIDRGVAELYKVESVGTYKNRQMRSENTSMGVSEEKEEPKKSKSTSTYKIKKK